MEEELGLFPLSMVLLPTERVPLHIFEERYKELIGRCLASGEEFGLVYADDEGIREIGTRAAVVEVLTRFEDGRLNVLVEGRERFRLVRLTEGESFQTGEVTPIMDDDDPPAAESVARALDLFDRLRRLTSSDLERPDPEQEQLSFAIAGHVELAPGLKLDLLAKVSERTRLELVCDILERAAETVETRRRAAERAATNGRVQLDA
jgi:Lon protease-like protein